MALQVSRAVCATLTNGVVTSEAEVAEGHLSPGNEVIHTHGRGEVLQDGGEAVVQGVRGGPGHWLLWQRADCLLQLPGASCGGQGGGAIACADSRRRKNSSSE